MQASMTDRLSLDGQLQGDVSFVDKCTIERIDAWLVVQATSMLWMMSRIDGCRPADDLWYKMTQLHSFDARLPIVGMKVYRNGIKDMLFIMFGTGALCVLRVTSDIVRKNYWTIIEKKIEHEKTGKYIFGDGIELDIHDLSSLVTKDLEKVPIEEPD